MMGGQGTRPERRKFYRKIRREREREKAKAFTDIFLH